MSASPSSKDNRVRMGIVLTGLILIVAAGFLPFGRKAEKNRDLVLKFAGLTNDQSELHAFLWMTNGSQKSTWGISAIQQQVGSSWSNLSLHGTMIHAFTAGSGTDFALFLSPHQATLFSVRCPETNALMRIVVRYTERAENIGGIKDAVTQFWYDHIRRRSVIVATGRTVLVTNEFQITH